MSTTDGVSYTIGEMAALAHVSVRTLHHYDEIWFYECSREIHCGLGDMYVNDPRFAATCESLAPGLAAYLRDAIVANAKRA